MRISNMFRLTFVFLLVTSMSDTGLTVETRRLSSRVVNTKYGSLRGFLAQLPGRTLPNVEVFLGVPYASPPLGSLRFMPPVTPSHWRGVRMADRFGAVCPQKLPDIRNETEALKRMPAGRLEYLKKLLPLLQNHSEDCLYLNIYVPARTSELSSSRLAVMVFIHGESYEWNSGNPYDGSILASHGNVVVVTVNYRLGIFGFLPALDQASRGNYGLMDQVAALHWVQENIAEFGGDPRNVTIVGHGPGAACVHLLMLSPMAKNLFQRGIMQSGSALSPWAIARSAKHYARELAEALNCPTTDNNAYMNCMRDLLVSQLLSIRLTVPDHLTAFGPTIDGIVVPKDPVVLMEDEETLFVNYDLLFGVNKIEYYFGFSADEDKNGIDNDRRDRIMRTLVRNTHRYHMQEIFLTVVNEYTDWTKPLQHTLNIMESASEAVGDATIVAPIIRVGNYHAPAPNKKTYFYVFQHQTESGYYPTRMGSLHGEELGYLFGVPLVLATSNSGGNLGTANRNAKMGLQPSKSDHTDSSCPLSSCHGHAQFALNYTKQESGLSEQFMNMWTSFAKTGDPVGPQSDGEPNPVEDKSKGSKTDRPIWPQYEGVHQKYLHINTKSKVKDHYNAHRLSFWLHLVPNLDQSRGISGDLQHHQLEDHENKSKYDGVVRTGTPGAMDEGFLQGGSATTEINPALAAAGGMAVATKVLTGNGTDGHFSTMDPMELPKPTSGGQEVTAPIGANNVTNSMAVVLPPNGYSTALSVTIAVGCSLLILNVLIFAGVYYQRDKKGEEGGGRKSPKVRYGQCSPCSANHDTSDPNVFQQQSQCTSQAESHFGTVHPNKHQFIRLPTSGSLTMTAPIHHHHHPHDNSPDFLHHESGMGLVPSVIGVLPPKVPPKPTNIGVSPQDHIHLTPEAQPLLAGGHQGDPNQLGVQVLPSNQHHPHNNQQQNNGGQGTLGRRGNNTTAQEMRILRAPLVQECVGVGMGGLDQAAHSPQQSTISTSPINYHQSPSSTSSPPLPPKSSSSSSTATTVLLECPPPQVPAAQQESVSPGVDGPRFLRRAHNPRLWGDNRSSPPATVCAACDEDPANNEWASSLQRRRIVPLVQVPRQGSRDSASSATSSNKGPCVQKETTV